MCVIPSLEPPSIIALPLKSHMPPLLPLTLIPSHNSYAL